MDKNRIKEALNIINQEIDKDSSNVDIAYQIYCQCNCFIAHEIKRIISSKLIAGDYEPPIGKFDEMAKRINEITKLLV